ncbi:MAG: methyltransferase [Bacteroidetes bacterium]|jgi:predicted O-methyltransferase YrrM|nr:methyltransferase [Bacteroidota bacterium]
MRTNLILISLAIVTLHCTGQADRSDSEAQKALNKQVLSFLDEHRYEWHNLNIPYQDGKLLHDIIVKNNYKNIVEIGTSTGHSTIWLAWAAGKTGGKVITIEINEHRYKQALDNFKEAGVSEFIDARLANAHHLVYELEGPIDFVFCDADKEWYKNYFEALYPKIKKGGCYTAHNVDMNMNGIDAFLDHIETVPGLETTINRDSGAGVSISYKRR